MSGERTGITVIHKRWCPARGWDECDCSPSYQGWVYDRWLGKKIREAFPTPEQARGWREDRLGEIAAKNEHDRMLLQQRRKQAWRATQRRATLAAERQAAEAEAESKVVRKERQRMARLIRQLPPDRAATGRAYGKIRLLLQEVDRAERAEAGIAKVRLRAAYQSLYDAEDSIKRAVAEA